MKNNGSYNHAIRLANHFFEGSVFDYDDDELRVEREKAIQRAIKHVNLLIEAYEYELNEMKVHGYDKPYIGHSIDAWKLVIDELEKLV